MLESFLHGRKMRSADTDRYFPQLMFKFKNRFQSCEKITSKMMSSKIGSVEDEIFGLLGQLEDVHSRLEKALQNAAGDAPYGAYLETLLAGRRQLKANPITCDKGTQTWGPGELYMLLKSSKNDEKR